MKLLDEIYYLNIYIEKDIQKAIYYFKEASCLNHSGSKNYLGIIYKNGDGVKKNIVLAIEYFKEAIKISKDIPAIYNLSRIYYFGIEIEQNENKAIKLLENELQKQINEIAKNGRTNSSPAKITYLFLFPFFDVSVTSSLP